MRLAILDDWFDTLRGLPCFSKLDGIDVTVFWTTSPMSTRWLRGWPHSTPLPCSANAPPYRAH